ncbi:VUT family protein [Ornithinimicrobium sp. Y1847]|uniref:VUT family protein n=1 Tax=Ornithinimicrobium sp. Y1847 TaxID=3405419 RepID=UPI003CFD88DB
MTERLGLVSVGFGLLVTAGTYAAGFALLARDFVHRFGGRGWGLAAIAMGGAISWALSSPALAVASTVAFVSAELVDFGVYVPIRRAKGFIQGALVSNIVSAPIDTFVFLSLAGFPLTMETVVGQFIGKVLWATALPLSLYWLGRRWFASERPRVQANE